MSGIWFGVIAAVAVIVGRRAVRERSTADARGGWIALAVAAALAAAALGAIWWDTHRPAAPVEAARP
jgi:hypothetical protein